MLHTLFAMTPTTDPVVIVAQLAMIVVFSGIVIVVLAAAGH